VRDRTAARNLTLLLYGLAGLLVAVREGVEINILGLSIGIDVAAPEMKLSAIGQLGCPSKRASAPAAGLPACGYGSAPRARSAAR